MSAARPMRSRFISPESFNLQLACILLRGPIPKRLIAARLLSSVLHERRSPRQCWRARVWPSVLRRSQSKNPHGSTDVRFYPLASRGTLMRKEYRAMIHSMAWFEPLKSCKDKIRMLFFRLPWRFLTVSRIRNLGFSNKPPDCRKTQGFLPRDWSWKS